jgi:hypothetical protein
MQVDAERDPDGNWHSRRAGHVINGNWYPEGQYGEWYQDPEGVWHPTDAAVQRQKWNARRNDPWSLVGSKKFFMWFILPALILILAMLCIIFTI